ALRSLRWIPSPLADQRGQEGGPLDKAPHLDVFPIGVRALANGPEAVEQRLVEVTDEVRVRAAAGASLGERQAKLGPDLLRAGEGAGDRRCSHQRRPVQAAVHLNPGAGGDGM